MRREAALLVVAASIAAASGCGSEDPDAAPTACLSPPGEYVAALEAAPDPVRLAGETPISDCIVEEQDPGQLAQVGEAVVAAATRLNDEAARDPAGVATVRLGYLVGAVQEAAAATGGIHADLVRRLDAAARYRAGGGSFPASFERAFGRGYAAGQASG